jgi:hypothetical protein
MSREVLAPVAPDLKTLAALEVFAAVLTRKVSGTTSDISGTPILTYQSPLT